MGDLYFCARVPGFDVSCRQQKLAKEEERAAKAAEKAAAEGRPAVSDDETVDDYGKSRLVENISKPDLDSLGADEQRLREGS